MITLRLNSAIGYLSPEIAKLSKNRNCEKRMNMSKTIMDKILKIYTLSPMQMGMLFHSVLDQESQAYFEQIKFTIHGRIDPKSFEKSFNLLVQRYDILRTNFVYEKIKNPRQVVFKEREVTVDFVNLSMFDEDSKKKRIEEFVLNDRLKGFDLVKDPLMRVSLLKTKDNEHEIIWSYHHILMDGWCMGIIISEFLQIYDSITNGEPVDLQRVVPYYEFINWLEKQDKTKAADYWRNYLDGFVNRSLIPNRRQLKCDGYKVKEYCFSLGEELTGKLEGLAKEVNVTLNTVFQTIWAVILQVYNGQRDVIFGSVVSGRPSSIEGIETMIGLFINTIAVRIRCSGTDKFSTVLQKIQAEALESEKYHYLPLAEIQAETEFKQELMDHIIVFENFPVEKMVSDSKQSDMDLEITGIETFDQTSYDFNIVLSHEKALNIKFSYNSNCYEASFLDQIKEHILSTAKNVAEKPDIMIQDLSILSDRERVLLLDGFNKTKREYPENQTMIEPFTEQVSKIPDNIALVYESKKMTYRELDLVSNRLANQLRKKGIGPGFVVGIMWERSFEMIISIFGILKSGAAYFSIDPNYPGERIAYLIRNSRAKIILTEKCFIENSKALNPGETEYIDLQTFLEDCTAGDDAPLVLPVDPARLMYLLYTSGSTGNPKGSMIKTHSFVNLHTWFTREFNISEKDKILLISSSSFDLTQKNFFASLLQGGRLCLYTAGFYNYELMSRTLEQEECTILNCTPSAFYPLVDINERDNFTRLKSLKWVFLGGEPINLHKLKKWLKSVNCQAKIVNTYGPTECTDIAASYVVTEQDIEEGRTVPIGKPVDNVSIYILNNENQLAPVGISGELCISGVGVGLGYYSEPELTKEKFVENPFEPGSKMYRTGDLARWLPDGN
ncbi:MAG: amino acid adenylation domain-containing protein, partial [Bacteroidales bacterium]|nr:amino acid adenylation domain-containing protein [Bacteroidales bacterium]